MRKWLVAAPLAAALGMALLPVSSARADDGRVAVGVAGGFLGGLLLGGALAPRPAYDPPYYDAPPPVYFAPPPERCYWAPGRRFWDDEYGVWRRQRVRVCD